MNEIEAILKLAENADPGTPLAMATVVRVQGSAYRRPGARMLITAVGVSSGMISGGCLEADVRERALQVIANGLPQVLTYDSTAPDDIVFGLGLGCGGIVQVLVEPLTPGDELGLLEFLAQCRRGRQTGRMATLFDAADSKLPIQNGARVLLWPDGHITANTQHPEVIAVLTDALRDSAQHRLSALNVETADGVTARVLLETVDPPVSLVIFGAGDDAIPVAQFAKALGWHVTVADARPAYAVPDRFPTADTVCCVRAETLNDCPQVALPAGALAMIMTHSYVQDKELLRTLLKRNLRYVGLLGPKARAQHLLDELACEGSRFSAENLERLHSPAGLDLGAETPEEIAISLLAEMQGVLTDRIGGPLRQRASGIH